MKQEDFTRRYSYDPVADLLGEGGFGRVYRAYDNYEHEYVALKIQGVDPRHPELRLRNEVEKVQSHLHKNVARYKGVYTFADYRGETDVAIMKYYNDGSLDKLLANGKLSREELFGLLTEILEGIAYLHSEGIIHRDLKPQNVLIVKHEGRYSPLITDFGISKQLDDGQSSAVSNSVLGGTRSYASPEQLKDSKIRKNTDLWSFGVITFQMLVGKLPFDCGKYSATSEEGRQEQFRQMMSGVLPEALDNVPEPWQRIIRECLIVDNERRIAHAEDCLAIIRGGDATAVEGNSTEVDPEAIAIPVEAVEVIPTPKPAPQPTPKVEPKSTPNPKPSVPATPAPKKRSKWWLWLLLLAIVGGGVFAYLSSQPKDNPAPTPAPSQTTAPARPTSATRGTINGHEWVDLGLPSGLKWATCNVGASNPGDYGNYYAWGETSPKSSYTEDNCSTWRQNIGDIAGTSRDAARQNWGGSWRMPRASEIEELINHCTWTWTTQNGHNGYKVTGPNGNSIFLPAAGFRYGTSSGYVGSYGNYWSSAPRGSYTQGAYGLNFLSGAHNRYWSHRDNGRSVRPVSE